MAGGVHGHVVRAAADRLDHHRAAGDEDLEAAREWKRHGAEMEVGVADDDAEVVGLRQIDDHRAAGGGHRRVDDGRAGGVDFQGERAAQTDNAGLKLERRGAGDPVARDEERARAVIE